MGYQLKNTGIYNRDEVHITHFTGEEVKKVDWKYRAHCTSYTCSQKTEHGSVIIENVSKYAIDCPVCNSVLFWERYK